MADRAVSERERVARAMARHMARTESTTGMDAWACSCGAMGSTDGGDLAAQIAASAHIADAVLGALDLDAIRAEEREQSDRLLAEVASHMAIGHRHAGYAHDRLGANLGCAGCALLARVEQHLEPTETGEPA